MSQIYILWSPTTGIDSVYSTLQTASEALVSSTSQEEKHNYALSIQTLIGGTVTLSADAEDVKPSIEKTKPKPRATKAKEIKPEQEEEEELKDVKPKPTAKSRAKPKPALKVEEDDDDVKEEDEEEPEPAVKPKPVARSRAKPKAAVKAEEDDEEEDGEAPTAIKAKKTKTPAEQRAANAAKPSKPTDADLPDNVRALLQRGGNTFDGQTVVVTGVPPTLGRKNTERLVEAFGAHLGKSLSKKTGWVVVGNDAGPKKLESIEELGLKTLDEAALVAMLEEESGGGGSGGGIKRGSSELKDEDEDQEEEDERPKKVAKRVAKK